MRAARQVALARSTRNLLSVGFTSRAVIGPAGHQDRGTALDHTVVGISGQRSQRLTGSVRPPNGEGIDLPGGSQPEYDASLIARLIAITGRELPDL